MPMDALRNTFREWSMTAFSEASMGDDADFAGNTSSGAMLDARNASGSGESPVHVHGRGDSADDEEAFWVRRVNSRSAIMGTSSRHSLASMLGGRHHHHHLQPPASRWAGHTQRITRNDFNSSPHSHYGGSGVDEEGERHHLRDCLRSVIEASSHSHSLRTANVPWQQQQQQQRTSDYSALRYTEGPHTPLCQQHSTRRRSSRATDGMLFGFGQSTIRDDDSAEQPGSPTPQQQPPHDRSHLGVPRCHRSEVGCGTPMERTEEEEDGKNSSTGQQPTPVSPLPLSMAALQAHVNAMQRNGAQQQQPSQQQQPQHVTREYGVSAADYVAEQVEAILRVGGTNIAHGLVAPVPTPVCVHQEGGHSATAPRHPSPSMSSAEVRARVPAMCVRLLSSVTNVAAMDLPTPRTPSEHTCNPESTDGSYPHQQQQQRAFVIAAQETPVMRPVYISGSIDEHVSERADSDVNAPRGKASEAMEEAAALPLAPWPPLLLGAPAAAADPCAGSSSPSYTTLMQRVKRDSLLCPVLCSADDHAAAHMLPMLPSHDGERDTSNAVNAVAASPKATAAAASVSSPTSPSGKSRPKPLLVPQPRMSTVDIQGKMVLLRAERNVNRSDTLASRMLHSMPNMQAHLTQHGGAVRLASVPLVMAVTAGDALEAHSANTDSDACFATRTTVPLGLCAVPQPYGAYPYQWRLSDPFSGSSAAAAWRTASAVPSYGTPMGAAALTVCSAFGPASLTRV